MSYEIYDEVIAFTSIAEQAKYKKNKNRQVNKSNGLIQKPGNVSLDFSQKERWVVNMSSRQLTIAETAVLEKGLNFAPTPNYMPISEIIVSTEQACSLLSVSEADEIRGKVVHCIKSNHKKTTEKEFVTRTIHSFKKPKKR